MSQEQRKFYPFSVIYGGAYSSEELNRSRRLDPVARAHYADFGKNPSVQRNGKDLFLYVSYRKSDKVYWTGTKRRIPKGEFLLSDGKNLARTRCGNRLSFTPQQPTFPEKEPPEETLNTLEAPKVLLPFDAPTPPLTEADLYVPSSPPIADLFSPAAAPFTGSAGSSPTGGGGAGRAFGPLVMPGAGLSAAPSGGAPFGGGIGLPVGVRVPAVNGAASPGASASTVPSTSTIPVGTPASPTPFAPATPVVVVTPEPATAGLLASGLVFLLFAFGRRLTSLL